MSSIAISKGRTNGGRVRERYTPAATVFPSRFPVPAPPTRSSTTPPVPQQHRPRLAPERWSEIAERAQYESLRDLAAEYGVSHETIRAVVQRVGGTQLAEQAAG